MPESSILIVGPPSQLRDNCELSVRRHATNVLLCEDCESAHARLASAMRAVIVVTAADEPEVEKFLDSMHGEHPHVPLFFVGDHDHKDSYGFPLGHGAVVLPPDMPASRFEKVFFPPPPGLDDGATASESEIVLLERREYPLCFAQARALFEKVFLTRVLKRERGNISRAARVIGMARRNLQIKIQAYQIEISRICRER